MIKNYKINNFKSFKNADIMFGKLNVLSGINGSGKSSILQSLLLIKSHFESKNPNSDILSLNNDYFKLGTVADVYHEGAEELYIKFQFNVDDHEFDFSFAYNSSDKNLDYLRLQEVPQHLEKINDFFKKTHYLQANRIGPTVLQEKDDDKVRNSMSIGLSGEFVYHYLDLYGDLEIDIEEREHENSENNRSLIVNTNKWLQEICPGISLKTRAIEGTDQISLSYLFSGKMGTSNSYRSTNVGFGISYVLPVIVQCLKAKKGDLIIIDTPEAHLHPQGQSKLGELFAKTAADGIQLIIETHSDHVINGIRKSVVQSFIEAEDTKFYFFERTDSDNSISPYTTVHSPKLDENAKFDVWPKGFFDEWTRSLNKILRSQQ